MAHLVITSSAMSLARQLWRLGEPDLAERALALTPEAVADIGERAGEIVRSPEAQAIWPDGPPDKALLIAAIEHLEGAGRPCARSKRLPEKWLPSHLQATEAELWASVRPVSAVLDSRRRTQG